MTKIEITHYRCDNCHKTTDRMGKWWAVFTKTDKSPDHLCPECFGITSDAAEFLYVESYTVRLPTQTSFGKAWFGCSDLAREQIKKLIEQNHEWTWDEKTPNDEQEIEVWMSINREWARAKYDSSGLILFDLGKVLELDVAVKNAVPRWRIAHDDD